MSISTLKAAEPAQFFPTEGCLLVILLTLQCKSAAVYNLAGTLVMAAAGPVVGMQDYPVILPDVLSEIQQAWGNRGAPLGTLP